MGETLTEDQRIIARGVLLALGLQLDALQKTVAELPEGDELIRVCEAAMFGSLRHIRQMASLVEACVDWSVTRSLGNGKEAPDPHLEELQY